MAGLETTDVLVIGAEQMSRVSPKEVGTNLLKASYVSEEAALPGGFAGIFGRIAELYFQRYGDQTEALAAIAAKNHWNGVANPLAQMRKDLGRDFCRTISEKNPLVAGPLKRTDCSPVSDGAAAIVLAHEDIRADRSIGFRAAVQADLDAEKKAITDARAEETEALRKLNDGEIDFAEIGRAHV